ncbi:MAG: hypothetical protein QOF98_3250 [Streptomyces sp.]|nr:hypothetical protein [Streptomyces sp.]
MVDDYWATAVKLFTGYPVPDRSTLFTNLTGDADHGKIPLINVTIEQLEFTLNTVGGPNIDGHDYVIPFYVAGSDGAHTNTKPVLHRALIDFINASGVDITSGGSEFGNVTDAFWSDADNAALDGSALGQYITGSVQALYALGFTPYSTQGLKVSGAAVPDASAVDMHTFSDTAKAFDRVASFFSTHSTTLQQWKDSLGKEQSAWKGKAAGVFWHLIDQLHKNYDDYTDQMHPAGFNATSYSEVGSYTSISKQGDALISAEKILLAELRQLHWIGAGWMSGTNSSYVPMAEDPNLQHITGIANPYAIVYSLLSEVERWAATHNRGPDMVTMTTNVTSTFHPTINTVSGGSWDTTTTTTYGTSADFKESFPGFGNLGALSTWQALGNMAVKHWNDGVDKFLVPQGKTSLSNVNNVWIHAQQVLDDVLTTKSTTTLSSSYQNDSTSALNSGGASESDDINKQIQDIQDAANKAIADANKAAQDAIDAANKAAQDAIDKANQAIKDAQDAAKEQLKEEQDAANKAVDEANAAAKAAQDQANQAIKDAQDQANQAIKDAQDQANQQIQELEDQLNGGSTTTSGADDSLLGERIEAPPADTSDTTTAADQMYYSSAPPPTTTVAGSDTLDGSTTTGSGVTVQNPDGSSTTTYPDGTQVTTAPDSSTTTTEPDGFTTTVGPDGTTTVQNPDGTVTTTDPDGTSFTSNPSGSTTVTDTSGTTTTTNPDGSTTVTDPAGTTTYPGGSSTQPPFTTTPPPVTVPSSSTTLPPPSSLPTNPFTSTSTPTTVSHATTSDGYAYDEASGTNPLTTSYGVSSAGNAFTGATDPFAATAGTVAAGSSLSPLQSAAAAQAGTTTGSTTSSPMMPPMGGGGGGNPGGGDSKNERVRNSGSAVLGRASGGGTSSRGGRPQAEEEEEFDEVTTAGAPFVPAGAAAGPGGQGGQATQSGDRERSAWLTEDEDVWGTEEGTTPAVIGR